MRWSWRLGTLWGIGVFLHGTFLLLLGAILLLLVMAGGGVAQILEGFLFILLAFACVVLHEFGHALVARQFGVRTRDITLYPIGGIARLEQIPRNPHHEFWIALAGPAVNLAIALGLLLVFGADQGFSWDPDGRVHGTLPARLISVNGMLAAFNLLPAFPMDGGRVLRAYLAERMEYLRATRIAATVGQGMAFLFGFAGLVYNPMLLFIAFFVYVGAGEEANSVQAELLFEGVPVRDAMMTDFSVLSPDNRVSRAVELLLAGAQQDFPVLEDGRMVGVLSRAALISALSEGGLEALVSTVMEPAPKGVTPAESLRSAYQRMDDEQLVTLPVLDCEHLTGLLTAENMMEYVQVRTALDGLKKPGRV